MNDFTACVMERMNVLPRVMLPLVAAHFAAGLALGQAPEPRPSLPRATIAATYTGDGFGVVRGGLAREAVYLDNLDLKLHLEGGRLVGWPGALLFVYVQSNRGTNPSESVGDVQGVSNIAAPAAWRLYEAWLQQNLLQGRVSLLGGLYDLNTEFDAIQAAGLFLNSSFGIGADYGQSGHNGPSIFPVTSLGVRVKVRPRPQYYLAAAVLDGVPGSPDNPAETGIALGARDGALLALEVAFLPGAAERPEPLTTRSNARNRSRRIGRGQTAVRYNGKYAIGAWYYTAQFQDLTLPSSTPISQIAGSWGAYALVERTVFREPADGQGLSVFGRLGLARPRVNRLATYVGAGATYAGLLPGRPDDEMGIGVAVARNGTPYRDGWVGQGLAEPFEATIELTYRIQVRAWFALQPDIQLVINPGTDAARRNAVVVAARGELATAVRWF